MRFRCPLDPGVCGTTTTYAVWGKGAAAMDKVYNKRACEAIADIPDGVKYYVRRLWAGRLCR